MTFHLNHNFPEDLEMDGSYSTLEEAQEPLDEWKPFDDDELFEIVEEYDEGKWNGVLELPG